MDSLSVAQAGIENAVSVPNGAKGFTWISYCWDWVNQFDTLIVFGDYEKGKITLLDELKQRFSRLRIKHVREEAYKDCKDANEILQKYGEAYVKTCVETAVDIPVQQVIELADVQDVNIYDIEKMKSGINDLDSMLYGGLFFGGVTIITGKSGKGKSSLASQILVNAVEQGYKSFAYSGELANHMFKAWFDYQIAGKNHIQTYTTRYGSEGYKISDSNKALINEWYRDNIYIYDSTSVEDENHGLINLVEEVISRYGVRVILIDNLMTALDLDANKESDKYERQSKFVKSLVRIAMKYNVLVLLVAHKRKNGAYGIEESDEVSGSSDITNFGSITLSYDVGTKKEIEQGEITAEQRKLKLLKNRVFGVINPEGWILDFEPKSKRIFGEHDDPNKEYGWTKGLDDGFDSAEGMDELPWGM
jgi:KaiC/GvpD/RAD55 family RecA-like ATPase